MTHVGTEAFLRQYKGTSSKHRTNVFCVANVFTHNKCVLCTQWTAWGPEALLPHAKWRRSRSRRCAQSAWIRKRPCHRRRCGPSERRSDAEREREEEVGQTDGLQGHNSSMHHGLPSDDNQSEYASKEPRSGEAAYDALSEESLAEQAVPNAGAGSSSVAALDMPPAPMSAALASAVRVSVPPAVLNSLHNTQAHILKSTL